MTAKQKVHQTKLTEWASLIQDQAHSGLAIRQWCLENNVSFYAFNYWKHELKEEYVDSCLPDIVPVTVGAPSSTVTDSQTPSRNSRNSREPQPIRISSNDVDISFSPTASDELILRVLRVVRYA